MQTHSVTITLVHILSNVTLDNRIATMLSSRDSLIQDIMEEQYWDGVASTYNDQIFDTLANDRHRIISSFIERIATRHKSVADFGCGVGKYLPLLSSKFKSVQAIDHSEKLLGIARRRTASLSNITFVKADLSDPRVALSPVDAAISINVLLSPDVDKRGLVLKAIHRSLASGGNLVLVVPSLESSLYSISMLAEWDRRSRIRHTGVSAEAVSKPRLLRKAIFDGVIHLEDQQTKHFLREEFEVLVKAAGFEIARLEKVEYSWRYEFQRPPRWMQSPYPW